MKIFSFFQKKTPIYYPQKIKGDPYTCCKKGSSSNYGAVRTITIRNNGERYPLSILNKISRDTKIFHPTQKPVLLLEYLIKTYTLESELALDNCIGAGSTAIACLNTNRNCIGIELDSNYYDTAKKRIGSRFRESEK